MGEFQTGQIFVFNVWPDNNNCGWISDKGNSLKMEKDKNSTGWKQPCIQFPVYNDVYTHFCTIYSVNTLD